MNARRKASIAVLAAHLLGSGHALAQPGNEAEAQRLFLEGRAAVERGDYATGCPKFAASLKLVERASTIMNLAQCEEREGRLRRALELWNRGISLLDPSDERMALARERATALEERIPRLTVRLGASAPAGTVVRVDGTPLKPEEIGVPLPMALGPHEVTLAAPGQPEQALPVELAERERKELLLQISAGKSKVVLVQAGSSSKGLDTQQVIGIVVGGLGLAGLVTAGITGAVIVTRDGQIQEECPDQRCSGRGRELIDGTTPLLIVNGVAWGVGIAGLGAGAFLLLTGGEDEAPAAALDVTPLPGGAWLALRRSF